MKIRSLKTLNSRETHQTLTLLMVITLKIRSLKTLNSRETLRHGVSGGAGSVNAGMSTICPRTGAHTVGTANTRKMVMFI